MDIKAEEIKPCDCCQCECETGKALRQTQEDNPEERIIVEGKFPGQNLNFTPESSNGVCIDLTPCTPDGTRDAD